MKKDWKYIFYLSIAFGVFLLLKLTEPKEYDWTPTYAATDKNPFGGYALHELIPQLFKGEKITVSNKTVYELKDSLQPGENIFILSHSFVGDKADTEAILKHVSDGANAFIAAQSFYNRFSDTLKIDTDDYLFKNGIEGQRKDSSYVKFSNPNLDTTKHFLFRRDNIHNFFSRYDTLRTSIIAENDFGQPVMIHMKWGKGNLILSCIPLAFTNIYLPKGENQEFISTSLSYLPIASVHWMQYYSVGRMEASTPLRFILTHEPLAWAYYVAVLSLLLFMVFESRRKQRIIPVMPPLENTSLEFVSTIGTLYFQRGDHKNIAEKKIIFFFDQIRTMFSINPNTQGENFILSLAKKSGKAEEEVAALFTLIQSIRTKSSITAEELIDLNHSIENFVTK